MNIFYPRDRYIITTYTVTLEFGNMMAQGVHELIHFLFTDFYGRDFTDVLK